MILDENLEICDATALNTGGAGTYLLGDQINLGSTGQDLAAPSDRLYLVITVDTLPTSSNSTATAQFKLVSDDSASISTTTSSVHLITKAFAISEMAAGTVLYVAALPYSETERYEQYLGLLQTTGTEAFTAGNINAFLTSTPPAWKPLPDAL